jgi:hypothetical protein
MEKKEMAGAKIYALVGIIIFGFLAYTMFKNNFDYISMDLAQKCIDDGGEWRSFSQECILDETKKVNE